MVIFQGGDGKPGYHQVEDLGAAIQHVEHLRNDEGVEQARIFHMEEVSFEFRPYFRVQVGAGGAEPDAEPQAEDSQVDEAAPADAPAPSPWSAPVDEVVAAAAAEAEAEAGEGSEEHAGAEPQPLAVALKAIVGEPAGEPWPEEDSIPAPPFAAHDAMSSSGARRGLFGR
jgi:hypothetical protein